MEILYVWIKKYRNIENQDFNLSGKYYFSYDEKNEKLKISTLDCYIPNFFQPYDKNINENAEILNISALIGENGTGKTSFLDFIKDNLPNGEGGIKYSCIIAYSNKKDEFLHIFHTEDNNIKNVLPDSKNIKYDLKLINKKNPEIKDLKDCSYIFYSSTFDSRKEFTNGYYDSNLINISTNYLIYKDYFDYRNIRYSGAKSIEETALKFVEGVNPVIAHRKFEFKRQLLFFKNKNIKSLKIGLPNIIKIDINEININSIFPKYKIQDEDQKNLFNFLNQYEKFFRKKYRENGTNKKLFIKTIVSKCIFFNLIYNQQIYDYLFYHNDIFSTFIPKNENIIDDTIEMLNHMEKIMYESYSRVNSPIVKLTELIQNNINFIKYFSDFIDNSFLTLYPKEIVFNREKNETNKLNDLLDNYLKTKPNLDFFDFDWVDFSSGQKAFLNIYSRFYEIVNQEVNKFSELKKDIIILIDEGELYFHPQWQKEFINSIINNLPLTLLSRDGNSKIKIQIILTSNSPIVLSDIPKNHVIFLNNSDNIQFEKIKQTFASNIYLLFSDAFFLRNGTIGDYAKEKIDKVIDILNNKDIKNFSEEEKLYVKNMINIIGEPIIKNKLIQMLKDKLHIDLMNTNERLVRLENKVFNKENKND